MKNKIKTILLVDDDKATNFFHKIIIEEAGCAEKVLERENVVEALAYLQQPKAEKMPKPDLIFLDINMPQYTGWDFLESYRGLPESQKAQIVIVMLSTSIHPDDHEKARQIPEIAEFRTKPLSVDCLQEIINVHF